MTHAWGLTPTPAPHREPGVPDPTAAGLGPDRGRSADDGGRRQALHAVEVLVVLHAAALVAGLTVVVR